jgi:uncharacterized membrane protein
MNIIKKISQTLLGLALIYAGIGHLSFSRIEFRAQVPTWLPLDPDFVVLFSGVIEILLGLALVTLWKYKKQVGVLTALFFIAIFPGNISQYVNQIDAFGLNSDQDRFIRLLFQPVLVLWALLSTGALKSWLNKRKAKQL